jgi:hypothetical protein
MAEVFPGVTNVAVFGQTEMSPVTCALDGADALRKIGSAAAGSTPATWSGPTQKASCTSSTARRT